MQLSAGRFKTNVDFIGRISGVHLSLTTLLQAQSATTVCVSFDGDDNVASVGVSAYTSQPDTRQLRKRRRVRVDFIRSFHWTGMCFICCGEHHIRITRIPGAVRYHGASVSRNSVDKDTISGALGPPQVQTFRKKRKLVKQSWHQHITSSRAVCAGTRRRYINDRTSCN